MAIVYNSELLIDSVQRRIAIPTNQNTYSDTDILAFADEELALAVVPAIMSLHEDHLLYEEFVTLVDGQREYEIPYRAVGDKLYDLNFQDSNGLICPMSRMSWSDESASNGTYPSNVAYPYYVKNNRIVLLPTTVSTLVGTLHFMYYIKPSSLVPSADVAVITAIDTTTGVVNFTSLPTTFSTATPVDFYKYRSPHTILAIDIIPTAASSQSNTMTFDPDDLPSFLSVGDHCALAEECCIPQIASDLHVYLAQKTAERILESQGDAQGLAIAQQKSKEMEFRAGTIIDNRVDQSPPKLVNRRGLLRSGLMSNRFRR